MREMVARRALVTAIAALAACAKPARVSLVVTNPTDCGRPSAATAIDVFAFATNGTTPYGVSLAATTELASLPADTQQIGVAVSGASGILTQGKTAQLALAELREGAELPIFMAPPNGFCTTGALQHARASPLVARAGDGVLVVGGDDASGTHLPTAEYYDPATARFTDVIVPDGLADANAGFVGCALTTLPDGTVALTGIQNTLVTFDATKQPWTLDHQSVLGPYQPHHAAIAIDQRTLLVIGGCHDPLGACSAVEGSTVYSLADGSSAPGPNLTTGATRVDARLFDIGVLGDAAHHFVLAGGDGTAGDGDTFVLADTTTTLRSGFAAQVAALDGGGVLSAFDADTAVPDGLARVLPPSSAQQAPIASAPLVAGARVIALEDGSAIAIGGDPTERVQRYDPTSDTWTAVVPAGEVPAALVAPSLARLGDGSVLVVGGQTASDAAWIFRPSLVGPWTDSVKALAAGDVGVLVASDPTTACRAPTCAGAPLTLVAQDVLSARVLVGGPRMTTGRITAGVRAVTGGVALVAQQLAPGRALVAQVVPGAPAVRVQRLDPARAVPDCVGKTAVPAFDPAMTTLVLDVHDGVASVSVNGAPLVVCDLAGDPDANDLGQWGVAGLGSGSTVGLVSIETAR